MLRSDSGHSAHALAPGDIERIPELLRDLSEGNCRALLEILRAVPRDVYGINSAVLRTLFGSGDSHVRGICRSFLVSSENLDSFCLCDGVSEVMRLAEIVAADARSPQTGVARSVLARAIEASAKELDGNLPDAFFRAIIDSIAQNTDNIGILCPLIMSLSCFPEGFIDTVRNLVYDFSAKNRDTTSYDDCILFVIYLLNEKGYKVDPDFILALADKISCDLGRDINFLYLRILNTCIDTPPHVFFRRIVDMLTTDEEDILQETLLLINKFFSSWTDEQKELIYHALSENIHQYPIYTTILSFTILFVYTPYCRTNLKILKIATNCISSFSKEMNTCFLNYVWNMILQTDPDSPEYQEILRTIHDSPEMWELVTCEDQTVSQVVSCLADYVSKNLKR